MKDGSAAPAGTRDLARALVEGACAAGLTVATAESCTAGMVASLIADVPGASEVLRGGAVTYCDEIKHRVLGVSSETLERYTAVSPQTAREMALGARSLFSTDMAVSLTGYAGPGGGTPEDPAGTVYIGLADAHGVTVERGSFAGGRNEVRRAAAARALELLIDRVARSCGSDGD
ncbi:CinA family protein [Collinsella vaginalis]|uniref:CinA family protein n=1 Tax=Collinsella vaginalis TaxID=1870987 RepID=UPI000A26C7D1|nr:CinA family protein [Collinsella vaginalis]